MLEECSGTLFGPAVGLVVPQPFDECCKRNGDVGDLETSVGRAESANSGRVRDLPTPVAKPHEQKQRGNGAGLEKRGSKAVSSRSVSAERDRTSREAASEKVVGLPDPLPVVEEEPTGEDHVAGDGGTALPPSSGSLPASSAFLVSGCPSGTDADGLCGPAADSGGSANVSEQGRTAGGMRIAQTALPCCPGGTGPSGGLGEELQTWIVVKLVQFGKFVTAVTGGTPPQKWPSAIAARVRALGMAMLVASSDGAWGVVRAVRAPNYAPLCACGCPAGCICNPYDLACCICGQLVCGDPQCCRYEWFPDYYNKKYRTALDESEEYEEGAPSSTRGGGYPYYYGGSTCGAVAAAQCSTAIRRGEHGGQCRGGALDAVDAQGGGDGPRASTSAAEAAANLKPMVDCFGVPRGGLGRGADDAGGRRGRRSPRQPTGPPSDVNPCRDGGALVGNACEEGCGMGLYYGARRHAEGGEEDGESGRSGGSHEMSTATGVSPGSGRPNAAAGATTGEGTSEYSAAPSAKAAAKGEPRCGRCRTCCRQCGAGLQGGCESCGNSRWCDFCQHRMFCPRMMCDWMRYMYWRCFLLSFERALFTLTWDGFRASSAQAYVDFFGAAAGFRSDPMRRPAHVRAFGRDYWRVARDAGITCYLEAGAAAAAAAAEDIAAGRGGGSSSQAGGDVKLAGRSRESGSGMTVGSSSSSVLSEERELVCVMLGGKSGHTDQLVLFDDVGGVGSAGFDAEVGSAESPWSGSVDEIAPLTDAEARDMAKRMDVSGDILVSRERMLNGYARLHGLIHGRLVHFLASLAQEESEERGVAAVVGDDAVVFDLPPNKTGSNEVPTEAGSGELPAAKGDGDLPSGKEGDDLRPAKGSVTAPNAGDVDAQRGDASFSRAVESQDGTTTDVGSATEDLGPQPTNGGLEMVGGEAPEAAAADTTKNQLGESQSEGTRSATSDASSQTVLPASESDMSGSQTTGASTERVGEVGGALNDGGSQAIDPSIPLRTPSPRSTDDPSSQAVPGGSRAESTAPGGLGAGDESQTSAAGSRPASEGETAARQAMDSGSPGMRDASQAMVGGSSAIGADSQDGEAGLDTAVASPRGALASPSHGAGSDSEEVPKLVLVQDPKEAPKLVPVQEAPKLVPGSEGSVHSAGAAAASSEISRESTAGAASFGAADRVVPPSSPGASVVEKVSKAFFAAEVSQPSEGGSSGGASKGSEGVQEVDEVKVEVDLSSSTAARQDEHERLGAPNANAKGSQARRTKAAAEPRAPGSKTAGIASAGGVEKQQREIRIRLTFLAHSSGCLAPLQMLENDLQMQKDSGFVAGEESGVTVRMRYASGVFLNPSLLFWRFDAETRSGDKQSVSRAPLGEVSGAHGAHAESLSSVPRAQGEGSVAAVTSSNAERATSETSKLDVKPDVKQGTGKQVSEVANSSVGARTAAVAVEAARESVEGREEAPPGTVEGREEAASGTVTGREESSAADQSIALTTEDDKNQEEGETKRDVSAYSASASSDPVGGGVSLGESETHAPVPSAGRGTAGALPEVASDSAAPSAHGTVPSSGTAGAGTRHGGSRAYFAAAPAERGTKRAHERNSPDDGSTLAVEGPLREAQERAARRVRRALRDRVQVFIVRGDFLSDGLDFMGSKLRPLPFGRTWVLPRVRRFTLGGNHGVEHFCRAVATPPEGAT